MSDLISERLELCLCLVHVVTSVPEFNLLSDVQSITCMLYAFCLLECNVCLLTVNVVFAVCGRVGIF